MNLSGKAYPEPHPAWHGCAEELLFYTSRYAVHAARRLSDLAEGQEIRLDGFQAQRMNDAQRSCMARLLSFPPDPYTARSIGALVAAVAAGDAAVPEAAREIAAGCRPPPFLQLTAPRPRVSTGLAGADPVDVLRHLGRRYGFPVRVAGPRSLGLDGARMAELLSRAAPRVRRNLQEVLQRLNRSGYTIIATDLQREQLARTA